MDSYKPSSLTAALQWLRHELHGGLYRADAPRVQRAHRGKGVTKQLAHHGQAILSDRDTGRANALAQLVHCQLVGIRHRAPPCGQLPITMPPSTIRACPVM